MLNRSSIFIFYNVCIFVVSPWINAMLNVNFKRLLSLLLFPPTLLLTKILYLRMPWVKTRTLAKRGVTSWLTASTDSANFEGHLQGFKDLR
jgi:hypothetical protein